VKFLSVCSGIEAASVAWQPLGWKAVAFSEIEPFPCALLKHHYPDTPNWGDMNNFKDWPDVSIDLLCGGTPCQSFSVAGLRKGLDDPRGNLMLTFGAIAAKYRPKWLVWENVPGVLSSNGGRDFGAFLGMLGQLGYGFAYRVLDAQYFGVAQRRRRVFVVGCLGDWHSAAAVLFERHSLQGHPAPSRQARQTAPTIPARSTAGGGLGTDFDCDGGTICVATGQAGAEIGADMAPTLNCNHEAPYVARSLRGEGFDAGEDGTGSGTPLVPHVVGALACNTGPNGHDAGNFACNQAVDAGHVLPVAFAENSRHELRLEGGDGQRTGALSTGGGKPGQGVPMIAFPANLLGTQCASTEDLAPSMGASNPTGVAYGIRTANTSSNGWGIQEECTHTLDCAQGVAVAFHPTQDPISSTDGSTHALGCGSTGGQASVAVAVALRGREGGATAEFGDEVGNCLRASGGGGDKAHVMAAMQVRRLTPRECERLQGFPDGYTAVPNRGKPAADGPRYKALGNSWAVPNVRWIGRRIDAVSSILSATKEMEAA